MCTGRLELCLEKSFFFFLEGGWGEGKVIGTKRRDN